MALTEKRIAKLREPGRYGDGNRSGLYLQVKGPENRSWLLRYEIDGRERWAGLGSLRVFNLAEARMRARKCRQLLADGVDPLEAKKANKAAKALAASKTITFREAARTFFDQNEKKWSNTKARNQFLSTLESYAFPVIGQLAVADVDDSAVLRVLEQKHKSSHQTIWAAIPQTADRVRGRIEAVLDWAKVRKYRDGENPARWRGHLSNVLPALGSGSIQKHHAALAFSELPAFMAALKAREGTAAMALRFTILTAARTNEVTGAVWSEIDLKAATWTIPAERMKAKREHRVPLSGPAVELLRALPRKQDDNAFIFVGARRGGLSSHAMAATLHRMGRDSAGTVHGMRSTFRDWCAERGYQDAVAEAALAHSVPDAVVAAYKRTTFFELRKKMMDDWARFATTTPVEGGSVVSIRRAQ